MCGVFGVLLSISIVEQIKQKSHLPSARMLLLGLTGISFCFFMVSEQFHHSLFDIPSLMSFQKGATRSLAVSWCTSQRIPSCWKSKSWIPSRKPSGMTKGGILSNLCSVSCSNISSSSSCVQSLAFSASSLASSRAARSSCACSSSSSFCNVESRVAAPICIAAAAEASEDPATTKGEGVTREDALMFAKKAARAVSPLSSSSSSVSSSASTALRSIVVSSPSGTLPFIEAGCGMMMGYVR